ncbi:MAG: hypothetical protein Q8N03_14700 [Ignavibacteria bacterium]|jgi:hypothetical protein|nr:hypothetical protein [Ignavibacteria bacterium]MDP3829933.1 hypothetical protein [Ignavibacteriaceae bacterium]
MDTDDLSIEAYDAILRKSEMFHHDLTLQFGVLTSFCENENEYLEKSLLTITNWESNIEQSTRSIFYDNIPELNSFKSVLKELKEAVKGIQKIPVDKRTYEEW